VNHYFAAACAANDAFQADLIRQFGDPEKWKKDYRYDLNARALWDSQTRGSHKALLDANYRRHQQHIKGA
jgi:hypothetical protein